MSQDVQIFNFESKQVRTIEMMMNLGSLGTT